MVAEPTLGDILAAALTRDEPLSAVEQAVADTVTDIWQHWQVQDEQVANRAMLACGNTLAADLAPLLNSNADSVFNALGHLPNAMLDHLTSPQGWSTLASEVAADLGRPAPAYKPTLH